MSFKRRTSHLANLEDCQCKKESLGQSNYSSNSSHYGVSSALLYSQLVRNTKAKHASLPNNRVAIVVPPRNTFR